MKMTDDDDDTDDGEEDEDEEMAGRAELHCRGASI